jgi:hypothetical protein
MAVDTRNKRASVLGLTLAALAVLPAPDGTVAQADRQQVAWCYAGISAEPLSVLNLHESTTSSLMVDRTTSNLTSVRVSQSLMTDCTTEAV